MTRLTSRQTEFIESVLTPHVRESPRSTATARSGPETPEKAFSPGNWIKAWCRKRSPAGPARAMPTTKRARSPKKSCAEKWSPCIADCGKKSCSRPATPILPKESPPIFSRRCGELVERLRSSECGCDVWAVSSSCQWIIRSAMHYFGIPQNRILAAEVAIENGTIDGTITDQLIRVPSGPGKVEAIRSVLMLKSSPDHSARLRLRQRDLGPRDARHVQTSIRHQPQSRSERDRARQRLDGLSAGRQPRWAVARFDSIICWLFTPKVLMRVYHHPPTPLVVESWGYGGSRRQNLEGEGLIFKIFRNKDLAGFLASFSRNS